MASSVVTDTKETKGQRTARRIMDIAEALFGKQGFEGTSLRQIAEGAGIQEPGLYNHFSSKQGLYEAVLYRALNPMTEALSEHMAGAARLRDYTDLPSIITDILFQHPQMAALFQQALQGDETAIGNQLVGDWLEKLFAQGLLSLEKLGVPGAPDSPVPDRQTLVINLIAIFNLTTGYFLSQRALTILEGGTLNDPDNIARQKRLLHRVIRAMLIT